MSVSAGQPLDSGLNPAPYTLMPLGGASHGLIAISFFSVLSFFATFGTLCFLTYRVIFWKRYYTTYIGYNQYLILIYTLLFADLIQIMSFMFSMHWLKLNRIASPTVACTAQGWIMQLGDVSMAIWALAIAIHSFFAVLRGRHFSFRSVVCFMVLGWLFAAILTFVGPVRHRGGDFWVRTADWCWISRKYHNSRVYLQYMWVTICQIGQFVLFMSIICISRRKASAGGMGFDSSSASVSASRMASIMSWFACIYILFTLPLQSSRMSTSDGSHFAYHGFSGSLATLTGLAHSILYFYTREEILTSTFDIPASSPRTRGFSDAGSDHSNPKNQGPFGGAEANFNFPSKPVRTFSQRQNESSSPTTHGTPHELNHIEIARSPSAGGQGAWSRDHTKRVPMEASYEVANERAETPWEHQQVNRISARSTSPDLHSQKPAQVWHAI